MGQLDVGSQWSDGVAVAGPTGTRRRGRERGGFRRRRPFVWFLVTCAKVAQELFTQYYG
jgi:hypothetical protein